MERGAVELLGWDKRGGLGVWSWFEVRNHDPAAV
jgi:hypothetical protein